MDAIRSSIDLKDGIEIVTVVAKTRHSKFDLFKSLVQSIIESGEEIREQDIIIISSKFLSQSQGNLVKLDNIIPTVKAKKLSEALKMDEKIAELVIRESDKIYGGIDGFVLSSKDGILTPNAGIDISNVKKGWAILYPKNPFDEAERLREKFSEYYRKSIGIIISDSRIYPTRLGTTGISVAVSGFEPVVDERGRKDLFGNIMKVTQRALADNLVSAAQVLMGETNESTPIVIIHFNGSAKEKIHFTKRKIHTSDLSIKDDDCVYIKGFANPIQFY